MFILLLPLLTAAIRVEPHLPPEYRFTEKPNNETALWAHHFMVPMPDGVKLRTIAWTANPEFLQSYSDESLDLADSIFIQSPYNLTGLARFSEPMAVYFNFTNVMQSPRGLWGSDGEFDGFGTDAQDAVETRKWITAQPWNKGRIMSFGVSADGMDAALSLLEPNTDVSSGWYSITGGNLHTISYPGGVLRESLMFGWFSWFNQSGWTEKILEQTNYYENHFYDLRSVDGRLTNQNTDFPATFVAGWYDIMQEDTIQLYNQFKQAINTPDTPRVLFIGPYGHCMFENPIMPNATDMDMAEFEVGYILNNQAKYSHAPTEFPILTSDGRMVDFVNLYVMYGNSSYWTALPDWPSYRETSFFLGSNGSLQPSANSKPDNTTYIYDPRTPTPTKGGNNMSYFIPCGPMNQTDVDNSDEVIIFESQTLTEDTAVCGPIQAELYVSSNCTDTDFMVKVEDVIDQYAELLIDAGQGMRWVKGTGAPPELIEPNKIYKATIDLWHTCKVFESGHKIRVAIQSSNFPRFWPNRNDGLPLNVPGQNITAENTVYYGPEHQSRLILPIVDLKEIPSNQKQV